MITPNESLFFVFPLFPWQLGLALTVLVECFTAEWEVTGSISGAGTILRVLK